MGSRFPPDTWKEVTGVWTVDADRTEAVADVLTGNRSIKLLPTAVATELAQAKSSLDKKFKDIGGAYEATALFKADRKDAGDDITIVVDEFDETGTLIATFPVFGPAVVTAVDVFEFATVVFVPLVTAQTFSLRFKKSSATFTVVMDSFYLKRIPRNFEATKNSAQTIPDNVFTTITSWGSSQQGMSFNDSTGLAVIPLASRYTLDAHATFVGLSDGQKLQMRARITKGGTPDNNFMGHTVLVGAAGAASVGLNRTITLNPGSLIQTVEIQVLQSGASATRDLASPGGGFSEIPPTLFTMTKLN